MGKWSSGENVACYVLKLIFTSGTFPVSLAGTNYMVKPNVSGEENGPGREALGRGSDYFE